MSWFLIAYTATGLSVAISPSYEKKLCNEMQIVATTLLPENKYIIKCEQHRNVPGLPAKWIVSSSRVSSIVDAINLPKSVRCSNTTGNTDCHSAHQPNSL
jgi:hypothetical protein